MAEIILNPTRATTLRYQHIGWQVARLSVIGLGIAIPLSHSLTGLFCIGIILGLLFTGEAKAITRMFMTHPVTIAIVIFGCYLLISASYSHVDFSAMLNSLKKHERLLFIPFIFFALQNRPTRQAAVAGFILSVLSTLCIAYYHAYFVPAVDANQIIFNRIETSFIFAFTAFLLAHYAYQYPKFKTLCWVLVSLLVFNIVHFNSSRTGYVALLALIAVLAWQRWRIKGLVSVSIFLAVILGSQLFLPKFFPYAPITAWTTHITDPRILTRSEESIVNYESGNSKTSIGYRLLFIKWYPQLILQAPMFGHGLGSTSEDFSHDNLPDISPLNWGNPHNYFLQVLFEFGVIGLLLFLTIVILMWRCQKDMFLPERHISQGLLIVMLLGSCCDNLFYLSSTGHLFLFFSAYCLVRPFQLRQKLKSL